MYQAIEHKGKIVAIKEQTLFVEMENKSACVGCKAKTFCSLSDQKEKQIAVTPQAGQSWSVGEEVKVCLRVSLGFRAVFLMYVLPLIVLLTVLFTLSSLGVPEWVTGLTALLSPLVCYFILWLYRDSIGKKYVFVLQKPQPDGLPT